MKDLAVIILAAGKSKRMKTRMPKVLHKVGGKCLIDRVLDAVEKIEPSSVHMVVGYEKEQIIKHIEDTDRKVIFSEQKELLGTGHAVAQAIPNLKDEKYIMVINGDMPLVNFEELESFYNEHISSSVKVSLMSAIVPWESDFGRIIRDENKNVIGIKEFKDSTDEEKKIKEVNLALYIFEKDFFVNALPSIGTNNAQKEYYLTDLISIASKDGEKILSHICADPNISRGVNSREDLAEIEYFVRESKVKELMKSGVTFIDPKSAFIDSDVEIGMDTVIYPFTIIEGKTVIGENCVIGPSSRIVNSVVGDGSTVANSILLEAKTGKEANIGPFAYLRPNAVLADKVKVGDFVEIKNSSIGVGTKVPHLSYIGDATLGEKVNIGAGTITCNYDGVRKHKTFIDDGTKIGSNTNLVAPVKVGKNVVTGAGATVTKDIPDNSTAVGVPARVVK